MTPYRRFLRTWIYIGSVGLGFGLMAMYLSQWFLIPFVGSVLVLPRALDGIVCPQCGTPMTYQGSLCGFRIRGGFHHKRCRACGWDLNK